MQKTILFGLGAVVLLSLIIFGIRSSAPPGANPSANENAAAPKTPSPTSNQPTPKPMDSATNPTITLETSEGTITLELFPQDAPKASENFTKLVREGFYNGVLFHRVIPGFMIQGGDPLTKDPAQAAAWGTGGPGYRFADELDPATESSARGYVRGTLAMANAGPNTNGSQFFIMHQDYPLPHAYTIFGRVTAGIEVVDKIAATPRGANDRPVAPITIVKATAN